MNSRIIAFGLVIVLVFSAGIASALSSPEPAVPFSYENQFKKTPYLTMTISASPSTIQEGETTTITIKVENTGTGDAKSIEVKETNHIGCNLINGSNSIPRGPNRFVSIGKFKEIKSGDYRTLEYILEPRHDYIKYYSDQSHIRFNIPPAVATYKDVDGNSDHTTSNPLNIYIQ